MFRAVASRGAARVAATPPRPPVEPDKSSLWVNLSSLDSVILFVLTCNCLPFSYFHSSYF